MHFACAERGICVNFCYKEQVSAKVTTVPTQEQILFPPFRMDVANEQLWREGRLVPLQAKAFAVLRYLVEHAGRLVTRRELTDAIWPDTVVSESVLRGYIRTLRDVLGDAAERPQFIETAARRGYRFIGPIAPIPPPPLSLESRVQSLVSETQSASSHPVQTLDPRRTTLDRPLVGREGELALLRRALEKALHGERQVVFVTGESGIGKTTVVGAFIRHVNTSGGVWLGQGQCVEH